jgi:hypothetical protein
MYKVLVLGLLISQSALAGFRCSAGRGYKLDIVDVNSQTILVNATVADETLEFDGLFNPQLSQLAGLYKTYNYDLYDSHHLAGTLIVSITPTFGRGCGRACQKSMGETVQAKLSLGNEETIYGCVQTID